MRHLPPEAKSELMSGEFVRHHQEGSWNGVGSERFGVQTAIWIGKSDLKGMILSPEMVTAWIDSVPITAHIAGTMDHIYPGTYVDDSSGGGVSERNSTPSRK